MALAERLLKLANALVAKRPDFFEVKGPGVGDRATIAFMSDLRARALQAFGADYAERTICGANGYCVDYYFPSEATIVEVTLGLPKPKTEFEVDVLKAVMAKEVGNRVRRLFFISKPGAIKKCVQPGRRGIIAWLARHHGIKVEIHELAEGSGK
jgi:hypothetical protein